MKIDAPAPIRDLDNIAVRLPPKREGEEGAILTVGAAMTGALLAALDGDAGNGQESFERFMLATRIHRGGEVELSIDEAKLIKDRAARCYSSLVVGRIFQALETAASSA